VLGELTADSSFTRIEEDVRRFWRRNQVPGSFRAARREGTPFAIRQQPLPVVGGSVADQVRLLATTDLLARYHAMRGSAVKADTGWICHGLSVEVAVERSLGPEITGYNLARFSDACRRAAVDWNSG
jgi:isoleucyl-tRNA synthetase